MRLVFAGTPEVAVPSLDALAGSRHELLAVVTRPDARAGRGRQQSRSAVARWADEHGLPVLQPQRPSEPDFLEALTRLAVDCCPVVAYGAMIPAAALAIPARGWVNLHFSLLPAWRGAAPVQRALLAGDEVTGASTFLIGTGRVDTGPVYGVLTETVRPRDTSGDLLGRLSRSGAGLLVATLDGIEDGALEARPQDTDGISLAPKVAVEEARVDWTAPAFAVDRLVRACTPAPGAWTTWRGERLKVLPVRPAGADRGDADRGDAEQERPAPGALAVTRREVLVGTGTGPVVLGDVQAQGKRVMAAVDWARGVRPGPGERLE
ncbi:MAG: methionyl-tRNA formyltransferase [Actinomycetales bacterium]|nr:methionyl-tRNA formyltransferase [Actinomycetales bacterium]